MSWISKEEFSLFSKIKRIVEKMPEIDLGKDRKGTKILVSCHILSRALAKFFPVIVKDGSFGGLIEHSWLEIGNGLIIDPYPPGVVGGPILVDPRWLTVPWMSLYKEGELLFVQDICFLKSVDKVVEVIRKTMTELSITADP